MRKLIDADAAIDAIKRAEALSRAYGYHAVIDAVEALPTVDAVPVVRCKDCRWRDNQDGSTAWIPCRALVTPNDFYCPRGERKDDNDS